MADTASDNGTSAPLAARSAQRSARSANTPPGIFLLRAMDRAPAMARHQIIRRGTRHGANGRYSIRSQLLQRRRLYAARRIHAGLVRWRASRALLQRRCVHAEVGPELGDPAFSLGENAREKFSVVAGTRPRCPKRGRVPATTENFSRAFSPSEKAGSPSSGPTSA